MDFLPSLFPFSYFVSPSPLLHSQNKEKKVIFRQQGERKLKSNFLTPRQNPNSVKSGWFAWSPTNFIQLLALLSKSCNFHAARKTLRLAENHFFLSSAFRGKTFIFPSPSEPFHRPHTRAAHRKLSQIFSLTDEFVFFSATNKTNEKAAFSWKCL